MLTTIILCLCIATIMNAGNSTSTKSTTTANLSSEHALSPLHLVIDEELNKIATSCITHPDHERLSGYILKWRLARLFNFLLIEEADAIIGLEELRAALGFAPSGSWKNFRITNKAELISITNLQEYFELTVATENRSLDSEYFYEKNLAPVIDFLDKRFPTIRQIFKQKFEESLCVNGGTNSINKKVVDDMIHEFRTIRGKVNSAMSEMNSRTNECEWARKHRNN
ncbi:unnamed protein product [Caenorhabditis angaria]|uniref:Uncharacterized protein n=1 Tax=Caenorhabditis angaria TaxID=860376 RepID=A0A9P1N7D2_9PELO|nr:unnamed protein product [Caenorhabditis angaria]